MKKKTTIYDVAEEADVSLATVSRVINGSNVVKKATRDRVLEAIKRLDFKPNQVARGLATSKSTTIAVVFPQSIFARVKDMIGGIGDTGRTLDYSLTMYTMDELGDSNPLEDVIERVVKSRADGVILFNSQDIEKGLQLTKQYNLPTAVIGQKTSDDNVCSVYVDAKAIGYELTKKYLDQGIDDILFVKARQNLIDLNSLHEGIKAAFVEAGKTFEDDRVITTSNEFEQAHNDFAKYLDSHKTPRVVIAGYDKEAVAFVQACDEKGVKIPDDLEIIGMVDSTYAIISRPKLTSVHLPIYDMGAVAVRMITKMLNEEEIDERAVCMKHTVVKRDSTKLL